MEQTQLKRSRQHFEYSEVDLRPARPRDLEQFGLEMQTLRLKHSI